MFDSLHLFQVGELERPLVSNDVDLAQDQSNDLTRNYDLEGECHLNAALLRPPRTQGLVHKQRLSSASRRLALGDSVVGDVSDPLDGILVGQTLKRRVVTEHLVELQKHGRPENQSQNLRFGTENDRPQESVPNTDAISDQRSCLSLQVVSGPSCGLHCSVLSTSTARLPLTLGRVPPSYLLLKDYEKLRWELVDMGSLNGTLLNSRPINHPDPGSRLWGDPVELASGDTITVHISSHNERLVPFGVGMTSDPMSLRRGGKKLPMEDVCYYHWPLPGIYQFGVFGICDGHGGVGAAKSASKILPEMVATILTDSVKRERVVSEQDASDVLRDAFSQTEASMNNYYEGCTATLLLVWADADENFFAQCANVGDSACFINMDGKQIKMTEDHKVTSCSERLRIEGIGEPLKDGETRLCGKCKFLHLVITVRIQQHHKNKVHRAGTPCQNQCMVTYQRKCGRLPKSGFYLSTLVRVQVLERSMVTFDLALKCGSDLCTDCSDGLWDVVSFKKAVQLVVQTRERHPTETENLAEKIADVMLDEARTQRTKDNTSIIFIDFDSISTVSSCKVRP
ncbi:hypothetical protein Gotri_027989 [Gossypium trilobum]|uniref:protein-serine/threonine phosphatase n=1 Tax=Gossypium trilobum TaxID=34281 RepID=A0A7J9FMF8_9ROSI|nr:hypothetical protein [Gossypium trilobum]